MTAALVVSTCGADTRHDIGHTDREAHLQALSAVVQANDPRRRLSRIVAATAGHEQLRNVARSLGAQYTGIAENPGHQEGALECLVMGLDAANDLGCDYALCIGDDVLPLPGRNPYARIWKCRGVRADWLSTVFSPNCPINCQVFACRVAPVLRVLRSLVIDPKRGIESCLHEAMQERRLVVVTQGRGQDYHHCHDPKRILELAAT